jgi:catechol 2,3-dioxygenase-like lactoylglutathione lyase family enzyme
MGEGQASGPLGNVTLAATSLYVADLDAAVAWYRDMFGLEPAVLGEDGDRYATYLLGGVFVVLEPVGAALEAAGPGGESTTVNLLVDRDPGEVRTELVGRGVACGPMVTSPGFSSFLVRDLDGNRFYVTRPVSDAGRQAVASAGIS